MDPYDSDSSGFEDEDYTETGVVLGYASEEIIEDAVTHIGGWPTWIDDSTPPPGEFAKCKVCNRPMLLLLELDGELYEHFPDADRRLYIFSCPRKACNRKPGSVRALRATKRHKSHQPHQPQKIEKQENQEPEKKEVEQPQAPKPDLGASLFGSATLINSVSANANPFSSKPASSTQSSNPFAVPVAGPVPTPGNNSSAKAPAPDTNTLAETFADKVRVSSPPPPTQSAEPTGPPVPWPERSEFPEPYANFYIDAEGESIERPENLEIPENVTIDTEDTEGGAGGADAKDTFESEIDKAFLKFSTRVGHNPEQVLRYEFRGAPVLYSHTDAVGKRLHGSSPAKVGGVTTVSSGASSMPRCESCGSERVFELQLVPHAISVLEEGREDVGLGKDDGGMEWGTIIMGVCNRNCGPEKVGVVGWREEWAGVQWEESQ
ncbi:programmed cell death protein 2 [Aspergillus varians]